MQNDFYESAQGHGESDTAAAFCSASGFDTDSVATYLRLSEKDKSFALALLNGANRTQAARMAGFVFEGDGTKEGDERAAVRLRKKASELAGTRKIKTFLELARAAGAGSDEVANLDISARRKILTAHAIGHDAQVSIRAIQELKNLDQFEADTSALQPSRDPVDILNEIASLGPDCIVIARRLAEQAGVPWEPKLSIATNSKEGA